MNLKQLLIEDRAVSPVIGVILMVAITVILAAVIGTFVLGLGGNIQSTPQATFDFDYDGTDLTITHDGGDSIAVADLDISAAETVHDDVSAWDSNSDGDLSAGESVVIGNSATVDITQTLSSGNEIRIVWASQNGDSTQTLAKFTLS